MLVVLAIAWLIGAAGLRSSSLHLALVALGAFALYGLICAVRRRHALVRERMMHRPTAAPPSCVTVRRLGEDVERARADHPAGSWRPEA